MWFVPRRSDYDLVQADAIRRLLSDARPDVVIHLAARLSRIKRVGRSAGTRPSTLHQTLRFSQIPPSSSV
jgi:nucleoside-diphosphate-sugar epimerase